MVQIMLARLWTVSITLAASPVCPVVSQPSLHFYIYIYKYILYQLRPQPLTLA